MYILKNAIGSVFMPVSMCIEITLAGLLVLLFTKKKRIGRLLIGAGFVLFIGFSYDTLPNALLAPLEDRYAPLSKIPAGNDLKWVVVLGGGHISDPRLPANSQLSSNALTRLVEGIRIHRLLGDSKLLLSGGGPPHKKVSNAEVMADAAMALGVDESDIVLESQSMDTKDEAILVREIIGESSFVLVTSAAHMPRSVALFRKLGMAPVPAPTDYGIKKGEGGLSLWMLVPGAGGFARAGSAMHEYMGLTWAWLRGQV